MAALEAFDSYGVPSLISNLEPFYWRQGNREVDFVVKSGKRITAIEVKSGRTVRSPSGLAA
ncbi:MAG TPA: hypothetical protein DIT55_07895, partial [Spirochaetaceae bacterium]|nr:hypothetical protein [Spirochaetaceae bacterium]